MTEFTRSPSTMVALPLTPALPLRYNRARMAMIHVARSGNNLGVFDDARVREGLRSGEFQGTDLGWTDGMPTWRPLSELDNFGGASGSTPAPAAPASQPAPLTHTAAAPIYIPAVPARTEPLAIWSLILSILGLFCCGVIFGIAGVVCGHMALRNINQQPALQGRGMAIAGLVIGYFAAFAWLLYIIFFGGMAFIEGLTESSR